MKNKQKSNQKNNEMGYTRITKEFLAKQAEHIAENIRMARTPEERELWASEGKALADNLLQCYGDSASEITKALAELESLV